MGTIVSNSGFEQGSKSSKKNGLEKTTAYKSGQFTQNTRNHRETPQDGPKEQKLCKINTDLSFILRSTLQEIETDITEFNEFLTDFSYQCDHEIQVFVKDMTMLQKNLNQVQLHKYGRINQVEKDMKTDDLPKGKNESSDEQEQQKSF